MRRISIIALLFIAYLPLFAQQPVSRARQQSWQALVYRIPADTLVRYVDKYTTSPSQYFRQAPFMTVPADSFDPTILPVGNYLIVSAKGSSLVTEAVCRSNIQLSAINNSRRVQLEVKDQAGRLADNAVVWVDDKKIEYSHETKSYWIADRKPGDAIVKVAVPGDTLIMQLERYGYGIGGWSQWWTNFSYTGVGRIITWPVKSVRKLFDGERNYRKRKHWSGTTGYIIFNKPQYKPKDTVRFKAYVVTRKSRSYTNELTIHISESYYGDKASQLGKVRPTTPGAYLHEFVLDDSLQSDKTYYLELRDKKNNRILSEDFRIEDYLLDEAATYSLTSNEKAYSRNDTLVLTASAKDANGLPVMDGRVKLYILTAEITKFHNDKVYVPDTLWQGEKMLAVDGDTKFEVSAADFPAADLSLRLKAEFLNSNNELQTQSRTVEFLHDRLAIVVKQERNYIRANLITNGKYGGNGWMKKDNAATAVPVIFPYYQRIDPNSNSYSFFILDDAGKKVASKSVDIESYYSNAEAISNKDSAGFIIYNSYRIPVHYTVTYGNRIIAKGGDSTATIVWKDVMPLNKAYTVRWQYIWSGEERTYSEDFAVVDKAMETTIEGASTIYPGQTDTISVSVKDYKGKPASDVNLSAVSYNSQFGSSLKFPDPPHLEKYRKKRGIQQREYKVESVKLNREFALGHHQEWKEKLGLDTMTYYKLLFPKDSFYMAQTAISRFYPQISVIVVNKGVPQRISILYINRQPVYYDAMTDQGQYAFSTMPGYVQVMIRLHDRLLQIDSIYLKPFFKHDISFDLEHLPPGTIVHERPTWFTSEEKRMIAATTLQLVSSSNNNNNSWIWQGDHVVSIGSNWYHNIGPFVPRDTLHFFKPQQFDLRFIFEDGYTYSLSRGIARLQKSELYNSKKKPVCIPGRGM